MLKNKRERVLSNIGLDLKGGSLIAICGEVGTCKTILALNQAIENAKMNKRILFISNEKSTLEYCMEDAFKCKSISTVVLNSTNGDKTLELIENLAKDVKYDAIFLDSASALNFKNLGGFESKSFLFQRLKKIANDFNIDIVTTNITSFNFEKVQSDHILNNVDKCILLSKNNGKLSINIIKNRYGKPLALDIDASELFKEIA